MEFGSYEKGISKIEINNITDDMEYMLTTFHELFHKNLAENTTYGLLINFLELVLWSDETSQENAKILESEKKLLLKHCLKVQEFYAIFCELLICKEMDHTYYKNSLQSYKNSYKQVDFINMQKLLDLDLDLLLKLETIQTLAFSSMNVNLENIKLDSLEQCLQNNELVQKCNPNNRFKNSLKVFLKNYNSSINSAEVLPVDLEYVSFDKNIFIEWVNKNIISKYNLLDFQEYMIIHENISYDEKLKIMYNTKPYLSKDTYKTTELHSLDEIKKNKNYKIFYIEKFYNDYYDISIIDLKVGQRFITHTNKIEDIFIDYDQIIFIDRYYYNKIKNLEFFKSFRLFITINNNDTFVTEFLENEVDEKKYFIYQLNNSFVTLFIKGIDNNVIIDNYAIGALNYIFNEFLYGYEYVNLDNNENTDGVFWLDENDELTYKLILLFFLGKKQEHLGTLHGRI